MSSTAILAGLGLAAIGFGGRYIIRNRKHAEKVVKLMGNGTFNKYYKGGFEHKMTKREAALILGISQQSSAARVKEAHKRIMLLNHPDRGGSPYLATKINEAKDYLESKKP